MDEKKFNKWFNLFIVVGMALCVIASCVLKLPGEPRKWLLILSTFGALMGVASVVLSANGSIWTFVFGLVDVLIYSYILYDSKLPSQLALYVCYFIPMEFIGFYKWRKRGADGKNQVKAQRLKGNKWVKYLLLYVVVYAVALAVSYFVLHRGGEPFNWPKSVLDAAITTANIVALVMMAGAYMEQWYLWTLVNLTAIVQWAITLSTAPEAGYAIIPLIKYSFYLINGLNAIRIWRGLSAERNVAEA